MPTTAAARAPFRKRKRTEVIVGFEDGRYHCTVVEIQEGKTTVVSIIELATYNLFNSWSCLAAPLRE
ncbi:hypothetical protein MC885_013640 [Smutsia gigantea]|nr:hypothetical protein MC885_013640 [Smutsia gigantea]